MTRVNIVIIPKRSIGALDAFLPLVVRLARREGDDIRLHTVILNEAIGQFVESSTFHADTLRACTNVIHLDAGRGKRRTSKVWKFFRLVGLLVRWRLAGRRLIVLAAIPGKDTNDRLLKALLGTFGTLIWFPVNQIGFTPEFIQRFTDQSWSTLNKFKAKAGKLTRSDAALAVCYRDAELPLMRDQFVERTRFSVIGTPRLFAEWIKYVEERSPAFLQAELQQLGMDATGLQIATIVVAGTDFFWFEKPEASYLLVDEVIDAVRAHFPDLPILIKVKPQHVDYYAQRLRPGRSNVSLTTLGLAVLAVHSRVAFGMQETSGIFDFLIFGVPVIEYGQYSQAWLQMCPAGSAYRHYPGVTHVRDSNALHRAVADAKAGVLPRAGRAALGAYLGDHDRLEDWIGGLRTGEYARPLKRHAA